MRRGFLKVFVTAKCGCCERRKMQIYYFSSGHNGAKRVCESCIREVEKQ